MRASGVRTLRVGYWPALIATLAATLLGSSTSLAGNYPPFVISGQLYESGTPVVSGIRDFKFELLDSSSTPIWVHDTSVSFTSMGDGNFEVSIAPSQPSSAPISPSFTFMNALRTFIGGSTTTPQLLVSVSSDGGSSYTSIGSPIPVAASAFAHTAYEASSLKSRSFAMTTIVRPVDSGGMPSNVQSCVLLSKTGLSSFSFSSAADCVVRPPRNLSSTVHTMAWSWSCQLQESAGTIETAYIRICGHQTQDVPCTAGNLSDPISPCSMATPAPERVVVPADWEIRIID